MCLAIPAEILLLQGMNAIVDIMGVKQRVNIQLIDNPRQGQYVLIHAGFAIQKVDAEYYSYLEDSLKEMLENDR